MSGFDYLRESIGVGSRFIPPVPAGGVTLTLADFLLDRIADEEKYLNDFLPGGINGTNAAIAGCKAKRRIVEGHAKPMILFGGVESWAWELKALALPYAAHPDYREEWRLGGAA